MCKRNKWKLAGVLESPANFEKRRGLEEKTPETALETIAILKSKSIAHFPLK